MYLDRHDIEKFLADDAPVVGVKITSIKGSTPRNLDAWMLVKQSSIFRTIGGGQLESIAIEKARALLQNNSDKITKLDIPLGPEIGQCCGGYVSISIKLLDLFERDAYRKELKNELAKQPHIYIFGAGHVGKALAQTCSLLPYNVSLIDSREEELSSAPIGVATELTSLPEAIIKSARPNSAYVVLTHDHALDFMIVEAAISRGDAAYIGMIGSKTKRASFESWYKQENGHLVGLDKLTCPIGGPTGEKPNNGKSLGDKRPEIIAALAASEIIIQIDKAKHVDAKSSGATSNAGVHV
ncbi:MAG: xanthine dehydrogenase accessory protein XdhC [Lentilitoribacter sp.]